jgi:membrane protein insertase Oxa1/YidC/SpoIIIJ
MLLQTKFWVKRRRLQRHLESSERAWLATDLPEKERYFRIYSIRDKRMKQYRITWTRYWISPAIQIANFLCFARAIRRIGIRTTTLSTEGILWFQNLSLPDAYQILPFLSAALIFCHIHYRPFETLFNEMIQKADNVPERKGIMVGSFRLPEQLSGVDIIAYIYFGLFLVWTHSMPSVMCLYLIPSFLWRLGYCAVIRNNSSIQKQLGFTLDPFIPLTDRSDFPLPKESKSKKRIKV